MSGRRLSIASALLLFLAARAGADSTPAYTVDQVRTEAGIEIQDLTYASDGLRVKGILFNSPVPGRRPAIVFNHGGVSGISKDMIRRSEDLARAGYMVLTPAYRGEGGSEGRVEVALGEVEDVLRAAEILRHHPRVDPDRIGLVGSSHGALLSVLAAARDRRIGLVVSACGVMDVVAWYRYLVDNNFNVSDSLSRAVYGFGPEDKPEAFRVRNATLVAPKIHVPVLFQQGLVDRTVPPDQPWRMVSALDRAGHTDHKVMTYPVLGHAFWFWNDPKSHTAAELSQADGSWKDLLEFLDSRFHPATGGAGAPSPDGAASPPSTSDPQGAAMKPASAYEAEIRDWQERRVKRLLADDGWLTVSGLYWLHEGDNPIADDLSVIDPGAATVHSPLPIATVRVSGNEVTLSTKPGADITFDGSAATDMKLTSDEDGKPEVLAHRSYRFFLIKRSRGYALRVRDMEAPARRSFSGIEAFPVDSTWRFEARFVPYQPPKTIMVPNIIGTIDSAVTPGYVTFEKDGQEWRLDPILESGDSEQLFFIFKDGTSGVETYPPGRFLYTGLPVDGKVTLDFNRAYNPPCAFTDFATCPLPPEQNVLTLRITAGEKRYGSH